MNKPSTKSLVTFIIATVMVLSALAVLTTGAYAASGNFTVNPTTFAAGTSTGTSTVAYVSGGTFGAGSTVYFFLSSTQSSSGIVSGSGGTIGTVSNTIGSVTLNAGVTTLNNEVTFKMQSGAVAGTYYVLAEDYISGNPSGTYALGPQVTLVSPVPALTILNLATLSAATGTNALTVGSTGLAVGSGFDAGASINVYLNYPGSSVVLTTATANSAGNFKATFTVPALSGTVNSVGGSISGVSSYTVVAEEMNTLSASFPEGGITADSMFDVMPSIVVSPVEISGTAGSTITITGSGFVAGQTIAASSSTSPGTSIELSSVNSPYKSTYTYNPAVTVGSNGAFTVTATLIDTLTTMGPYNLEIILSGPSTTDTFSDAVYISAPNPAELGLFFYDSSTSSFYSGYPGDSIMAAVYDFPAQTSVSIYLGSVLVGTVTTDSNGFAQLPSTATLPAMPAGIYYPTAVASTLGLYVKAQSFTVTAFFEITDPSGAVVTSSEYVPNTGNLTVSAFGLTPQTPYTITDEFPSAYASYSVGNVEPDVVSTSVGTALGYPYYAFVPASNGTLIFTYTAAYSLYSSTGVPLPTGTASTIAFSPAVSAASGSDSYSAVGPVSITHVSPYTIYYPGEKTQAVTVSNIIPSGATAFYPGISNVYSMYLGSQLITLPNGNNYFTSSTSTATVTFNVPSSFPNGLTNESIVYYKQPVSAAIATLPVVVSSPGTSLSSGFLITVPIYKSGVLSGYEIIGYGLDPSATFSLYYMTYSGVSSSITPSVGASSGAFAYNLILPYEPAGTYAVFLTATLGTSTNTFYSSYTVMASLNVASVTYNLINLPVGYINSPVYVSASGLQPNTYYDVYFAGMYETTLESDSSGTITAPSSPSYTFEIPLIAPGTYNVTLNPTGTSTSVASAQLVVSNPPNVVINGGLSNLAFPTQLITFSWEPSTPPNPPSTAYSSIPVTVYLNGTAYTTVLATYGTVAGVTYLNGSFAMPNDASGSYWGVSFGWSQTSSYQSTLGGSAISFQQSSYTGNSVTYMQLYSGAGALVTISPSQVATIIAAGLHQALQVPLSELNATIASINGTAVKLSTSVGTLTTTLSAINANVTSIMKGQAVLSTDLGNMEVSLQSINASIAVVNGGIVTLQTSLGTVQTTLNNLAPVIMDINGSVMTIGTTVGNINMNLTAFRNMAITAIHNGTATVVGSINGLNATMQSSLSAINAKLVAVNGNIATVQTSLGTVQTSLNSLNATVTSINGNVATVQTSLGTLSGTVTSINNGVATIQTSLGTLQTSVNGVNSKVGTVSSSVGNTMIFEVVVLILVLITLVLAGLAMNSSNKLAKKIDEMKKQ